MKILVDADSCPVRDIIVKIAKKYNIPVFMFGDTSHILNDGYSTIITVDKAKDSADFAIANKTEKSDIVVTQDYGLAVILLAKQAYIMHQNGFLYTEENIDRMLLERHISSEMRRIGKKGLHPKKRNAQNNHAFEKAFNNLCIKLIK